MHNDTAAAAAATAMQCWCGCACCCAAHPILARAHGFGVRTSGRQSAVRGGGARVAARLRSTTSALGAGSHSCCPDDPAPGTARATNTALHTPPLSLAFGRPAQRVQAAPAGMGEDVLDDGGPAHLSWPQVGQRRIGAEAGEQQAGSRLRWAVLVGRPHPSVDGDPCTAAVHRPPPPAAAARLPPPIRRL